MASGLQRYTTEQLRSNRRMLILVRAVMLLLFCGGLISAVAWILRGEWHPKNIGVLAPAIAVGVILLPIQVQISVIARELSGRKPTD
ncbi:MAG: hypothetical protein AB8G99_03670 [Planctomycetaceae bacterium]